MKSRDRFHPLNIPGMDADRQGLIFYLCRNYKNLPDDKKQILDDRFREVGGEHEMALRELLTTAEPIVGICMRHYIGSPNTLCVLRRRYYEGFPIDKFYDNQRIRI